MVARPRNRAPMPPVIDQRIYRLLQHAFLVAHDDLGRTKLLETLQAIVPVDYAPIEVVQIAGGEPATVELDHRPKVRWQDRQNRHDHPRWVVPGLAERLEDAQSLRRLLASLTRRRVGIGPQLLS